MKFQSVPSGLNIDLVAVASAHPIAAAFVALMIVAISAKVFSS